MAPLEKTIHMLIHFQFEIKMVTQDEMHMKAIMGMHYKNKTRLTINA